MSPLATKDRCRSCHAAISFGITAKGKRMPLDVDPVVWIEVSINGESTLRGLQVFDDKSRIRQATTDDIDAGASLYRSHFATCPDADRFRR